MSKRCTKDQDRTEWKLKFHRTFAAATVLIVSAAGPSIATAASGNHTDSGAASDGVTSWTAPDSDRAVLDFWTPERISQAASHPLATPTVIKEATDRAREHALQHANGNSQKPATASADAVAPLRSRKNAAPTSPLSASIGNLSRSDLASPLGSNINIAGRLFFDIGDNKLGTCSAAVVVANNKNSIWTAGHCLHSGKGGGFYSKFLFAPGYDETAPWGFWNVKSIIVSSAWADDGDHLWGDMGGGIVTAKSEYGNLQDWIGAYGYRFNSASDIDGVTSLGYPTDGYNRPSSDFHNGSKPMYCHGNAVDAGNWNPFDDRLKLPCDMGHGASGGPIVSDFQGNSQIVGTNSHRVADSSNNWTENYMYSSSHGGNAVAVINWLNAH
ncbi:trypsin-like serine peptidase [Kitasatospora sp. NPDC091335]|uniref:trypsin-like serine peptidase n=1 Tax=Kitasatospora sp. NPDC091335 TaxID=3364085 RepID=UPI003827FE0C